MSRFPRRTNHPRQIAPSQKTSLHSAIQKLREAGPLDLDFTEPPVGLDVLRIRWPSEHPTRVAASQLAEAVGGSNSTSSLIRRCAAYVLEDFEADPIGTVERLYRKPDAE